MQGIILAAGKGTRLQPVTPARTKAMAPVAGKPIVARVLDLLVENDITDILLLVSPDDPDIQSYFAEHTPRGVTVTFVTQQERLGMAHALGLLAPYIHGDFLMSACDNLVPATHIGAMIQAQQAQQASAVLSLMEIDIAESATTGIVAWAEGWIERIVEKPQPADAPSNIASLPLYLFTHKLLDYLPHVQPSARGEYELQDAIQMLIDNVGRVTGVTTPQRWQLTNVSDLLDLNRHFLANDPHGNRIPPDIFANNLIIHRPTTIAPGSTVGNNCVIGPHVYIEPGCQIGDDVHLSDVIVLRGTAIPSGSKFDGTIVMST